MAPSWHNRDQPLPGMVSRRPWLSTRDRPMIQTHPHRITKNPPAADGLGFMELGSAICVGFTDGASCGGGGPKLSRRTTSHTLRIIFYPRDRARLLSLATD